MIALQALVVQDSSGLFSGAHGQSRPHFSFAGTE